MRVQSLGFWRLGVQNPRVLEQRAVGTLNPKP